MHVRKQNRARVCLRECLDHCLIVIRGGGACRGWCGLIVIRGGACDLCAALCVSVDPTTQLHPRTYCRCTS